MPDKKLASDPQKDNKHLILMIGVSGIAFLIAGLWFLNFRQIIFQPNNNNTTDRQYWQQLQAEVDQSLQEFNVLWDDMKTSDELVQGQELIDQIKDRIENDSSQQATSTVLEINNEQVNDETIFTEDNQSTINNSLLPSALDNEVAVCPKFIDCLLKDNETTIDCTIPIGCENISVIVY